MSIGPWFKCKPDNFVKGMSGLNIEEQAFYTQLVMRMYDAADAIYANDKTIAKWCNSNAARWVRVKASLIDKGRIHMLPDGGLIDERVVEEIVDACALRKSKVSQKISKRFAKLALYFEYDLQNISKTTPETPLNTTPLIEEENRKDRRDISPDGALALEGLRATCERDGTAKACAEILSSVVGWQDGVIIIDSMWKRDRFGSLIEKQLRDEKLKLAVQGERVGGVVIGLKAIAGGKP